MSSAETTSGRRQLPHWLVVLVVVVTGGFTVWAMSMTRLEGPTMAWDRAHDMVDGVWGAEHDGTPIGNIAPIWAQSSPQPGVRQVAGFPGVPPIVGGAAPTHTDRGVCTNCHTIVTAQGAPVPSISSTSAMPHAYRGVCSNCHQFTFGASAARAVAGLAPGSAAGLAPPAATQPTEAEWQGLEVAPSPTGVVVKSVEGAAARRGVVANDVVVSINGRRTPSMTEFVSVTDNGKLQTGALIVNRNGERLAFEFGSSPAPTPVSIPPAQPSPAPAPAERQF